MIDCFFIGRDPGKYCWLAQYRNTNEIPEISQNQDSEKKIQILEGKISKLQAIIKMYHSLFSKKKKEREREREGGYQTHLNHYIQTKIQMKNEKDIRLLSIYYVPDTFTYHLLKCHNSLQVIISNLQGSGSKETSTFLMHSAPQSS